MNNLDKMIASIMETANEKAETILAEANEKLKKLEEKNKLELIKQKEKIESINRLKIENDLEKMSSRNELDVRNLYLEYKQKAVKDILDLLYQKIQNFPDDKMLMYCKNKLADRKLESDEKIYLAQKYETIKKELESFKNIEIYLSDKIKTGILIEKKGVFENYSLEALVEQNKDEIEMKIQEYINTVR